MNIATINTYLRYINLVLVVGMDPDPKSDVDTRIWIETASGYDRRTKRVSS